MPDQGQQDRFVLGPDDKAAFSAAPVGFDIPRDGIPHGKTEMVQYYSSVVGTDRHIFVYTPPGYSPEHKYPVLYLLHGIGGDEREWANNGHPEVILDNLYAEGKLTPMIVVFPNGRAQKNDRPEGNIYAYAKAFETFEFDLLEDIIPTIEATYPVKPGRENRALAGLSMGGGQALNFGLGNLDTFAWVGAFSPAPNTYAPKKLLPNPEKATQMLRLLYLSCGDQDSLIDISQGVHRYLQSNQVPHIWHVDSGAHNFTVWKKRPLSLFSENLQASLHCRHQNLYRLFPADADHRCVDVRCLGRARRFPA